MCKCSLALYLLACLRGDYILPWQIHLPSSFFSFLPATYYLLPKAFAALKQQHKTTGKELSLKTLRNAYKDKEASAPFIARKLAVFTIYDKLRAAHGISLKL